MRLSLCSRALRIEPTASHNVVVCLVTFGLLTLCKQAGANLEGCNMADAKLQGANLRGANIGKARLHGANLEGSDLARADMHEADLTNANLARATLCKANLKVRSVHVCTCIRFLHHEKS